METSIPHGGKTYVWTHGERKHKKVQKHSNTSGEGRKSASSVTKRITYLVYMGYFTGVCLFLKKVS
jgi:hypothetical protein